MSQESHYTSRPRGLKPGSRGFRTVACTPQMPSLLTERLENLSGYHPVFAVHDPSAALNPINFSHIRLTLGAKTVGVLSRIGPAGLDYTGRANKYAHHVVLENHERPVGGPAWLLSQADFLHAGWTDEPRLLPEGRPVPQGNRPAGIAEAWQALSGDAGWAGGLAEAFLTDPRRPVFVISRPGIDLLPLFAEALALVPPPRRWEVEFGTYLTQVPQGITYTWRGVLDSSSEAKNALRLPNALTINLCAIPGRAQVGALVHLARTGERLEGPATSGVSPTLPAPSRGPAPSVNDSIPTAGPPPRSVPVGSPANV